MEDLEKNKEGSSGWNMQKTIVTMLAVIIVMLALLCFLILSGKSGNEGKDGAAEDKNTAFAQKEDAFGDKNDKEEPGDSTYDGEDISSSGGAASQEETTLVSDNEETSSGGAVIQRETTSASNASETSSKQTSGETKKPDNAETKKPDTQTETAAPAANIPQNSSAEGSYKVDFSIVNSWEENGKKFYQLSGTLYNTSSVDINSWKIEKGMGEGSAVVNSWNCSCSISGGRLIVSPADYNSKVASGASVADIGIIISAKETVTAFSYTGTAAGTIAQGGSSGNNQGGSSGSGSDTPVRPVTPYVPPVLEDGTPVGNHGALSVKGTDIVDKDGRKFQLKGVSTHGLQWFPQYVNKDAIKTLRDNWGANVFRLAMYTHEGGYSSGGDKAGLEALVSKGVEACTELGMYVIIDWHVLNERDPNVYKADALVFFDRMSAKYKDNVNVIYEICNEPNGPGWPEIKKYADEVISVIRKNDPDAIIIVGTPTWSQEVDKIAADPVSRPHNVMYALHFYAATHKEDLRNKLKAAIGAGTPVFVSEFSICDASGNGGIDYNSAQAWKDLINSCNLSYVSWSLCNKSETSALIKSSCSKTSGWGDGDLSETGAWIRNFIAGN